MGEAIKHSSPTTPTNRHLPKHRRRPLPVPVVFGGAADFGAGGFGVLLVEQGAGGEVLAALLGGEAEEEAEVGAVVDGFAVGVGAAVGQLGAGVAVDTVAELRVGLDVGFHRAVAEEGGDRAVVEFAGDGFDVGAPVGADQVVVGEDRVDRGQLGGPGGVQVGGQVVHLPAAADLGAALGVV